MYIKGLYMAQMGKPHPALKWTTTSMYYVQMIQTKYIYLHVNAGECWSGQDAANTYNAYGASKTCMNLLQQTCDANSVGECAGDQNSNYVYRIVIFKGKPSN